jgi:septum formation protein
MGVMASTFVQGPRRFVLASASPARLAMLRAAGLRPEVIVSHVDESTVEDSDPAGLSGALARMKAETVAASLAAAAATAAAGTAAGTGPGALVLGCDSVLAFDDEIMGKPATAAQARTRWQRMRARHGVLHTGHCVIDTATGKRAAATSATKVHFAALTDEEIDAYVGSGEPMRVAGAFTIDGLGGPFVTRIEGDHGTVVGVSLPLLRELLTALEVSITSLWHPA